MRALPVLVLARMLLRFFSRRVLRVGVLRSGPVRAVALVGVALLLATCAVAAYVFLAPLAGDERAWDLLFTVSTVSALLWVQVGFLLVKVLFLNAGGLLRLSHQLPVTHRERAAAFLLYEAAMTGLVAGAGFFAVATASVVLLGPAGLLRLLEALVLPMLLAYLLLTVVHLGLARACSALGLRRLQGVVLVLVLFGLLLGYTALMPRLTAEATAVYLHGVRDVTPLTVLPWLHREAGPAGMLAAAAAAAALLAVLALALSPREPAPSRRFAAVRLGRLGRHVDAGTWFVLRSTQTWLAATVAVVLYAYLAVTGTGNPVWALGVASMSGLYQFAATRPLRTLPGARRTPAQVYAGLLRSQCVALAALVVPGAVLAVAAGLAGPAAAATAALGCLSGALVTVGIGIVFPAENDNPFSVFIGLGLTAALLAVVGLGLGLLHLPRPASAAVVVAVAALFVWYGVQGIRIDESRRRHEEGSAGRQQRRGSRGADDGARGGHHPLPHVHHV